jgi:hypothetical protein
MCDRDNPRTLQAYIDGSFEDVFMPSAARFANFVPSGMFLGEGFLMNSQESYDESLLRALKHILTVTDRIASVKAVSSRP